MTNEEVKTHSFTFFFQLGDKVLKLKEKELYVPTDTDHSRSPQAYKNYKYATVNEDE